MNYLSETFLNDLNERFSEFSFEYSEISYSGIIPVFFIKVCCTEKELETNWKQIVDYIAVHFQTSLKNEFSVWNLYLFFILKGSINNSLKYQIENDTFSSRKIIVEFETTHDEIITEHIKNTLEFGNVDSDKAEVSFKPEEIIENALTDVQLTGKKKITIDIKGALDEIIDSIKISSNEN